MVRIRLICLLSMLIACLLLVGGCALQVFGGEEEPPEQMQELPPEFERLLEVWELLQREHINGGALDSQTVSDGAIRGMLAALDDPYAAFFSPEQYNVANQDLKGFFEGIGAQVGIRNGHITILAPMPGTPAERAGIRPGDVILEIEGESTEGISLLEAVNLIRGPKGTVVNLLVLHDDAGSPVPIAITRGVIPLTSVEFTMNADGIGHLRVFNFASNTNDELLAALRQFEDSRGRGLVLDLRNNPGGLLSAVVDVTSQFLGDGLVLYQIDAKGNRTDWGVKAGGQAKEIPMVVLVNEFSASASEVFAGAIMDHERAIVIGETTFGKGSVNNLWPLTDGSGVNFTIAHWFTPKGTLIEGAGITPDIVLENVPNDAGDLQLERAVEILQEQFARGR